jgi:hypothetical protein
MGTGFNLEGDFKKRGGNDEREMTMIVELG